MKLYKISQTEYEYVFYKRKNNKGKFIPCLKNKDELMNVYAIDEQTAIEKIQKIYPSLQNLKNYGFILIPKKTEETREIKTPNKQENSKALKKEEVNDEKPKYWWQDPRF